MCLSVASAKKHLDHSNKIKETFFDHIRNKDSTILWCFLFQAMSYIQWPMLLVIFYWGST
jgi:hypothetical protein